MSRRRLGVPLLCAALGAAVLGSPSATWAKDPEVRVSARSLLGGRTPESGGWMSVLVRLENPGPTPVRGTVEVQTRVPWFRSTEALSTRLPFSLAPGASSRLEAPTRGFGGGEAAIRVRALDDDDRVLAQVGLSPERPSDALVLHLSSPSRVAPVLRGMSFASRRTPLYGGPVRTCAIGVSSAELDPKSGDPLLPLRPSEYGDATLVLGAVRSLARLGEAERASLAQWILAGGALALSLDRPEDVNDPMVRALVGGAITRTDPPEALLESAVFLVPPEEAALGKRSHPPLRSVRLAPSEATQSKLVAYQGGNLRASDWGASASYGLGEVHLLAFDPDDASTASDPWVHYKLSDLVRHAFDREPLAVVRNSAQSSDGLAVDNVRRELDPNQATRWTIVVSALVLLIYAVLAGPVAFYLAARRGRPLRALFQLPIWSAAALGVVVVLGIVGKGLTGRARRLTLVDAGAGMTTGAAVFFRAFYAASSRELLVRAGRREHVLDLAGVVDIPRTLAVDRDGPRLTRLRTRPWETLLIREDGFFDLSGGISLVPQAGGDTLIRNRVARDLIGVIVKPPRGDARYFPRIRDGESVLLSKGEVLGAVGLSPGTPSLVPLGAGAFASTLEEDFPGLGRSWQALEPAVAGSGEWWPPDVPVLIAALDGGQGKMTDSGLRVDYDRVLVRVVGTGGVP